MLILQGVRKLLGGRAVLHGIDLTLRPGTVTAVRGASGAGKSTLLHVICGVEPVDAGAVRWADRRLDGEGEWLPPWKRPFAVVFQQLGLWPHLTVEQHLDFVLRTRMFGRRRADVLKRDSVLESLELLDLKKRYPSELSGGQAQRVAVARTLIRSPELLLLDEPLGGLDAHLRTVVWSAIEGWQKRSGGTVVVVSHDMEWAIAHVDSMVALENGLLSRDEGTMSGQQSSGGLSPC